MAVRYPLPTITVSDETVEAVPSNVKVLGHPLHPILVPFPIAFLGATLLADLVARTTRREPWARIASISLMAGIVSGALAAFVGALDFLSQEKIRRHETAVYHLASNGSALAVALVNLFARRRNADRPVGAGGLLLSLLMNVLLTLGGWFGGELVYRFRIGVER